jgi:hypothetical protein
MLHPGTGQWTLRLWIFGGLPPFAPLMPAAFAFFSDLIEPSATAALFFIGEYVSVVPTINCLSYLHPMK